MRTKYAYNCDVCHYSYTITSPELEVYSDHKTGIFQFVLDASPLNRRCPLDNEMSLYTTCVKVDLGQGGKGLYKPKKTSNI